MKIEKVTKRVPFRCYQAHFADTYGFEFATLEKRPNSDTFVVQVQ